jgi:glucosamine-6-phosphate deaminase
MPRKLSAIAPDWWDYTTLDSSLIDEAARLTVRDLERLSRPGFEVVLYDTLEDFYLAEALEYIDAWRESTDDAPVGICGPIGPTEQLPLVARLVNSLDLDVRRGHFWGMDEWFDAGAGSEVPATHPLSFERADRTLCFDRIRRSLRMPDAHLHFPKANTADYRRSWDAGVRCAVMQGGQGDVKHWAFNDPLPRIASWPRAWSISIRSRSPRTLARVAAATSRSCRRRRSRSDRWKPGRPTRCRSGTPAGTTIPSASGSPP